jgi:type III secretion system YscQ/HrcQ family protein
VLDPPLALLVLAPLTLCRTLVAGMLGPVPAFADPAIHEALLVHLVADVIRCLPRGLPAMRLDGVTTIREGAGLAAEEGGLVMHVRVRTGGRMDLITVILPPGGLEELSPAAGWEGLLPGPRVARELLYPVALVAGRTRVPALDLGGLAAGDVVVVDSAVPGLRADGPGDGMPCELAVMAGGRARFVARARLHADGVHVTAGGPLLVMEAEMQRDDEHTVVDEPKGRTGSGSEPSRVRDLPAELCVEVGRVPISVGELMALAPGAVIPLARPVNAEVTLSVGGRELAHGVLVEVEGEMGVQVLKLIG